MFEQEVVTENEAGEFAKSIGAIFYLTSAKYNVGINDLFNSLGKKFLDNSSHEQEKKDVGENKEKNSVKLKISKTTKKKKKC